jgi:hypothetical protein
MSAKDEDRDINNIIRKLNSQLPNINSYPSDLRGPTQNRFGGHKNIRQRTYGGKFGAANAGRRLSRKGRDFTAVEADLKKRGVM